MKETDKSLEIDLKGDIPIPEKLPILPVNDMVIFPHVIAPLVISDDNAIKLVNDALSGNKLVGIFTTKDRDKKQIYPVGTVAAILKMFRVPDGSLRLLVQGNARIVLRQIIQEEPYLKGLVARMGERIKMSIRVEALMKEVNDVFLKIIDFSPYLTDELKIAVYNIKEPDRLADLITSNLNIDLIQKQDILATADVEERLKKVLVFLNRELRILELGSKIQSEVKSKIDKDQREFLLREQLKAIKKELGEEDEQTAEVRELKEKIEAADMPEEVQKVALKELDRLSKMPPAAAEYTVSRTYLDWLVTLPWNKGTEDRMDIYQAQKILDTDHYGLEDVKERMLEFLAVRKLKESSKGPILCFVGPPGVGKTSLGMSIARALGRKFVRISLGGVRDEAEIRGHRRTYIGSLPGRIIQKIRAAESNNPVFMMDEVDKIGQDFRGDPAAALLEVLDPEQNHSFSDHYLDVPFDLSKVLFITTANVLTPIPPALLDRLEIIKLPGYITIEKLEIARRYLVPRQIEENGLTPKSIRFTKRALEKIITGYTREAGVRTLEKKIAAICRKVAKDFATGKREMVRVTPDRLEDFLGPEEFIPELALRRAEVGVATGLAWTPVGGEVIFVESTRMKGGKSLELTGQLGDVMKESAGIALSYVRAHAKELGIAENFYQKSDIHLHVPAGATPKDGPSAGVAMVASLASLFSDRSIKPDVAMTGEINLQGQVLPVGGIKEKVIAARRAGIKKVVLPKQNEKDLKQVPDIIREKLEFVLVDRIDGVLKEAMVDKTE